MKFPIAREVFDRVEIQQAQEDEFKAKVATVVEETLQNAAILSKEEGGAINSQFWRKLKQVDGLVMYRERANGSAGNRRKREVFSRRSGSFAEPPPPMFLVMGRVASSLDDLMFAMSTATAEEQRTRSSYVPDGVVDCQLLKHIVLPTAATPNQYLNLQWLAMDTSGVSFTKPRDFVVLNGAGMVDHRDMASRVGYFVRHSIQFTEASRLKVARGAMSICGIYRELSASVTHVYMSITIEPRARGVINSRLATALASNYAFAVHRIGQICQMKKLTIEMLTAEKSRQATTASPTEATNSLGNSYASNATSAASSLPPSQLSPFSSDWCETCNNSVKWTSLEETESSCALCYRLLCRNCRVRKELSFPGRYNRVHRSTHTFCSDCIGRSMLRETKQIKRWQLELTTEKQLQPATSGLNEPE